MRFSLVAILPAVLWTALFSLVGDTSLRSDAGIGGALIMYALWFVGACAVALYWGARIVRFALRSPRAR